MKGCIVMSNKEGNRISIMEKLITKRIKQKDSARLLGLSVRQVRRLEKRYREKGPKGLIHRSRGKSSHNQINPEVVRKAMRIVGENYHDFGPTLAWEKLTEIHGFPFSVETLRKEMIRTGVWQPKRQRKPRIHQMRERRPCEGELVQMDGSPHAWFEDRRPECTLLGYIDDATGKVKRSEFFETETTLAYFKTTEEYLRRYGKPLAFYADKNSIFRINTDKGGTSSVNDSQGLTQFGRAMKQLDIELIPAHSPQAKGRIEKLFETLQDRLVKELRLRKINTLVQANRYLPEFIIGFNQKFGVKPKSLVNVHRPLLPTDNLERILAFHHPRVLSRNLTCQFENKLYRIETKRPTYAMRHAPVLIIRGLKGTVTIEYQGRKLDYTILEKQPKAEAVDTKQLNRIIDQIKVDKTQVIKTPWKPPEDHPWRYFTI